MRQMLVCEAQGFSMRPGEICGQRAAAVDNARHVDYADNMSIMQYELDGVYWEGVHKPEWTTKDLLAAHLLHIPAELIDTHKQEQCEESDCRYCLEVA